MSIVDLIERVAKRKGTRINKLPNGVVIIIKDDYAYVQITVVRDVYYIRYLTKNEAYIAEKLNERIVEKILDGELTEREALKIPDV
ncbi:hypothetical protein IC006_2349 [Sulfuracidifex tepidarius]|uniref:Uncharacterized protein n=1 Tax=Sulfuracidifex tepidarius TaxID=1294262 RepID=A0A510DXS4_9CREN|nr:hypothetical protein [Sulfuracidifex tepidarius]BBG25015.1 hypothetical protein IC006_2349 [Sulfuracidifex tepidarius]